MMNIVRLGNYVKIKTGKLDANAANENGEYPFFTCSVEPLSINTYSYDCECVLIAGNGDLNVKYYNGKFDAYQRTYIVESLNKEVLTVPYLYRFMDKYIEKLREQSIGGVIKYIKLGNLTEANINLPTCDEQNKIVENLAFVDNLISKTKKQLTALDVIVKSRFIEMFGDLISNTKGWKYTTLNEMCDVRDGTHDSPKAKEEGYPLLTSKNFSQGYIDFNNYYLISEEDFELINKRSKVDKGDIIMPMIGTIGSPVIVDTDIEFAIKNVALIKFINNNVSNVFIQKVLDSNYFKNVINQTNRGNTQKFISLRDIRNIKIPIVPIKEQNQFADFVAQVDKSKLAVQQSLNELETLKKSLMQQYFG